MVKEYTITMKNDEFNTESIRELKRQLKQIKKRDVDQVFSKVWKKRNGTFEEDWVDILYDKQRKINTGIKFKGGKR